MPLLRSFVFAGIFLVLVVAIWLEPAADRPAPAGPAAPATPKSPLSPKDELATFKVLPGFRVELAASEPEVVDPVAMAFDEEGSLYVAEMRGYPNKGVGTGTITSGRIRKLTEPDDKGVYRKSTVYAEGLRFPNSVLPYRGGLLVTMPPDILYFEDTNGDGVADKKRVLYTGFELKNIQAMVNGLQYGLDNWVHANGGGGGGTIRSGEAKDMKPLELRSRGVRFRPDQPGSLEATSGGGQFGLVQDEYQRWFTATNSQHLRHIVLPDHYLARNPYLPVSAVVLDIPDGVNGHGAVCKVNRISPFEAWRVERTGQRAGAPDAKRFAASELVPGGFVTSSCSPLVYTADLFPGPFRGNTFVCEPANNLIHRDILEPTGATFSAKRADADCEFLASTDIWFRPVYLTLGPDGAIYVADFYREAIETPLSLPEDIKKKMNLDSQGRGRIWRIVPEGSPPFKKPALGKATSAELVDQLANPNSWWRLTAQRLLVERGDKATVPALKTLLKESNFGPARAHALWTLHALGGLDDTLIEKALEDRSPGVREQALRLSEDRLAKSAPLRTAVARLADDNVGRVRFQLAFTLGAADAPELTAALAKVLRRDADDRWTQTAVLSSAATSAPVLLDMLVHDRDFLKGITPGQLNLMTRLAALIGARSNNKELAQALQLVVEEKENAAWQVAVLEGLGQGQQLANRSLAKLWQDPPAELKDAVGKVRPFFQRAAETAKDGKKPAAERIAAVRLLGYGPFAMAESALPELLAPSHAGELQQAAVRSLARQDDAKVFPLLLSQWNSYGPDVRREVVEAFFTRTDRLRLLLDAIEKKTIAAAHLEPARVDQLRNHRDAEIKKRATALLASRTAPERQKIIDEYKSSLALEADPARGKLVFQKVCASCHRLENEGKEVGPDLLSALKTKTRDGLLIDILDPSREVDPRYVNYVVSTKGGKVMTGMIAANGATSLTLRRANKEEEEVLRSEIDEVQATAKSLMPDELEKQLDKQQLADLIAYLMKVSGRK